MSSMASLTMYDMLTMLMSGYLWSILLFQSPQDDTCLSVLFGVTCYVIGLAYHKILDVILGPWNFKVKQLWKDFCSCVPVCKIFKGDFWLKNRDCLSNDAGRIARSYAKVEKQCEDSGRTPKKKEYYEAYYHLMKNNCLGNIPVLEAHVAFIRNIVPILIVYLVTICFCSDSRLCQMVATLFGGNCHFVWIPLLGLIVILICARFWIQNKIHVLVWEGDRYKDVEGNN